MSWFICLKALFLLRLLKPVELEVGCCPASFNVLNHLHTLGKCSGYLILFYLYCHCFAIAHSLHHNSFWLFTRTRLKEYILFTFAFYCYLHSLLKDFALKTSMTCLHYTHKTLFKSTSGILKMLQGLWSTDSGVHHIFSFLKMWTILHMFCVAQLWYEILMILFI